MDRRVWVGAVLGLAALVLLLVLIFIPGKQRIGHTPEALAQMEAFRASRAHEWMSLRHLLSLLQSGDFISADQEIGQLHQQVMKDISWEDSYFNLFDNLNEENGFTLQLLNRWVRETDSAISYLARGSYYKSAAHAARGNKWASQTSKDEFLAQKKLARKAVRDLKKALLKDGTLTPAHGELIWLSTVMGHKIDKEKILADAIAVSPGTYSVRLLYITTLEPKWDGSFLEMEVFADESEAYLSENPRLWLLKGLADEQKGFRAWNRNDCDAAIVHYSNALQYGVYYMWLNLRANCLAKQGKYDEAMQDLSLSLQYSPNNRYALKLKNWIDHYAR